MDTALRAAKEAEKIILGHYSPNSAADFKPDNSPVTVADREAESAIVNTIKKEFPDHGFIGEEGASRDAEYQWIIDPIDGTLNYMRGIFLFSTEIALVRDGIPLLGVSNIPTLKMLMKAEKGKGAHLNGEQIRVSKRPIDEAYIGFGNLMHFEDRKCIPGLISLMNKAWRNRGYGDFIGYHFVAKGALDVMLEARVRIWDVAAQKIIVEEAGGKVTDFQGNPVGMETDSAIASNGVFHDEIVASLQRRPSSFQE